MPDNLVSYKDRRGIMPYRFEGLTFNNRPNIEMSRDLAQAIQKLRTILGTGNITHSGVYRSRPQRRSQYTGEWITSKPYTGHYFWDAIDIRSWESHTWSEVADACESLGISVIREPQVSTGIAHVEVNRPHNILRRA